ncbi:putative ribonuclease H-like domain-containing protein [Tanacetum coccineum]
MMTQKLGNGFEFIKKACFVCGSFNHLIKDYYFHDNKMIEKPVLNNKGRVTGQREIRPVWNNVQRVNHQNKLTHPHPKRNFVPTTTATKLGQVPVNAAKQNSPRAASAISTAGLVNTAALKSKVNDALPKTYSYFKAHSPVRWSGEGGVRYGRRKEGGRDEVSMRFLKVLIGDMVSFSRGLVAVSFRQRRRDNAALGGAEGGGVAGRRGVFAGRLKRIAGVVGGEGRGVGGGNRGGGGGVLEEGRLRGGYVGHVLVPDVLEWLPASVVIAFLRVLFSVVEGWDRVSWAGRVNNVTTVGPKAVVSAAVGYGDNDVKSLARWIWRPTGNVIDHTSKDSRSYMFKRFNYIDLQGRLKHMTGNKSFLTDYQDVDGGFVAFARSPKGGKITGKGKIRTGKLDFKDTECLVLSPDFKLLDKSQVLLKVPRQNNMYSFDLKNFVPSGGLTCLFAKATIDESNLWHRRLGHINFKTMNKLVKGNLLRDQACELYQPTLTNVAYGFIGPTSVRSINHKIYYLIVTDDYSRFSWVFFLATKDETSGILKTFITGIENQINHKVKIIRYDNGTEFKNRIMNEFYDMKGIRREFSVARTPQQNGIAERKNKTLIEAARTMLADSKLPTTFWAEAVNTACYAQNRVLVIKPHNKTYYELFLGRKPALNFMRPFGCPVTILNTLDHLGKFDGKSDDGFFVGYSINSKAFRVFNTRTRFVEENLHINFLENKPNVAGTRPNWMFDIDTLTMSMNYQPVFAGNQTNGNAGTKENIDAGQAEMSAVPGPQYVLLPFLTSESQNPKSSEDEIADDAGKKNGVEDPAKEDDINGPGEATNTNNTNRLNTVSSFVNTVSSSFTIVDPGRARDQRNDAAESSYENRGGSTPVNAATPSKADYPTDPLMPNLKDTADLQDTGIFGNAYDDKDVSAEADLSNLETTISASPIPTTRINKDHPKEQIIGDINSAT